MQRRNQKLEQCGLLHILKNTELNAGNTVVRTLQVRPFAP